MLLCKDVLSHTALHVCTFPLVQGWSSDSEKGTATHSMWYYLTIYFFISMAQVVVSLVNQVCV